MTLAISIIGGAAVLAAALALFFWQRQKRAVWTRYRKAAQRIIREEYLDASIGKTEYGAARPVPRKLMVALEIKGARGKGYVFDPEREIRIGRAAIYVCRILWCPPSTAEFFCGRARCVSRIWIQPTAQ